MSRVKSNALDYFPLDTGFFKDPRIRRLTKRFGADGPAFYLHALCTIYGGEHGFYAVKNEEFIEDAAIDLECSTEKVELMLEYLLSRSLLISISLSTVTTENQQHRDDGDTSAVPITVKKNDRSCGSITVLTSHGIQAQYQRSAKGKRRDIEVQETLWILDEKETEGFVKVRGRENKSGNYPINPGIKAINPGNKPQSKLKEIKRKESKMNVYTPAPVREDADADDGYERFLAAWPKISGRPEANYFAYMRALDSGATLEEMLTALEWQRELPGWKQNGGQYIPSPEKWLKNRGWTQKKPEVQEHDGSGSGASKPAWGTYAGKLKNDLED